MNSGRGKSSPGLSLAALRGDSSRSASRTQSVKAFWKSGINGFPPKVPPFIPFSTPLRSGLDSSGHPGSSTIVVSLRERTCMSNFFPKRNLPLRVVLNRVGEATLATLADSLRKERSLHRSTGHCSCVLKLRNLIASGRFHRTGEDIPDEVTPLMLVLGPVNRIVCFF